VRNAADAKSLTLRRFGVAYGQRVVLSDVSIDLPKVGVVTLVGPTGTGKSTLLRTLAGLNRHLPSLYTWGEALYEGKPLAEDNSPALVSQNTRLLTSTLLENLLYFAPQRFAATPGEKRARAIEALRKVGLDRYESELARPIVELPLAVQRLVAIARAIGSGEQLILIDEPTFGLEDVDAEQVLRVIRSHATVAALLVVMHNQRQVRRLGGVTALLAGGVIQELRATEEFFSAPASNAAREFVETGTCADPSPSARDEDLETGIRQRLRRPPAVVAPPSQSLGPRGFVWLFPGKLAGTPRPGVVANVDHDLTALKRVGVTTLISLTSSPLVSEALERFGMGNHWFPVVDMGAPSIDVARQICSTLDRLLAEGATVAVHCRAGHGRTGTILVAYLIWGGRAAIDALETARRLEPKWVQSEKQVRFLEEFSSVSRGATHSGAALPFSPSAISFVKC
jgi:atypical dual specificity phosphatase